MSIAGLMRTSVSGMGAQSNRLSAVSSNIANASTVGYKSQNVEFASLVSEGGANSFSSGGIESDKRYAISHQGVLTSTNSSYDLAINGNGFLLVEDDAGRVALTRAGAFVPDEKGHLVNAAGLRLLGMPASDSGAVPPVVNGISGLEPVMVTSPRLEASATTAGRLAANLPAGAAPVASADLPSANVSTATSSARTSVVVYGSLGEEIALDIHYARTSVPGEWEVTAFDSTTRSSVGGFPYGSGPLATRRLTFDATGQLSGPGALSVPVPGGATIALDLIGTSQLATGFSISAVSMNGNPPSDSALVKIDSDGTIVETYANGTRRSVWQIALATVASPDHLNPRSGTVFDLTMDAGDLRVGVSGSGGLGRLVSGALEASSVDIASELTDMIEAQRNYSANAKVFQTGAELLDIIVNLKR
jgi:flagellar hook protein FlgE